LTYFLYIEWISQPQFNQPYFPSIIYLNPRLSSLIAFSDFLWLSFQVYADWLIDL